MLDVPVSRRAPGPVALAEWRQQPFKPADQVVDTGVPLPIERG